MAHVLALKTDLAIESRTPKTLAERLLSLASRMRKGGALYDAATCEQSAAYIALLEVEAKFAEPPAAAQIEPVRQRFAFSDGRDDGG